jgi:hypothetical protein
MTKHLFPFLIITALVVAFAPLATTYVGSLTMDLANDTADTLLGASQ